MCCYSSSVLEFDLFPRIATQDSCSGWRIGIHFSKYTVNAIILAKSCFRERWYFLDSTNLLIIFHLVLLMKKYHIKWWSLQCTESTHTGQTGHGKSNYPGKDDSCDSTFVIFMNYLSTIERNVLKKTHNC